MMPCPECGNKKKPEVFTNILKEVEHPAYMIYALTCSVCGHQFTENEDDLVYGNGYDPDVSWFGGIQVTTIKQTKRTE